MRLPFEGLTKLQIGKLLVLLGVHRYKYSKGEEIIPTIKNDNIIGIVLDGFAQIINIEYNGNEMVQENLGKDSVFGTTLSATNSDDCQIIAKEDTEVLIIDYVKLMRPENTNHNYFNIFLSNLFDIINTKYRETNERVKVLEKKQIREKLLKFFEIEHRKSHSKNIYLSFPFKDLADHLAIDRSAMFRELKHLKDDKLIEVDGRKIKILYEI